MGIATGIWIWMWNLLRANIVNTPFCNINKAQKTLFIIFYADAKVDFIKVSAINNWNIISYSL